MKSTKPTFKLIAGMLFGVFSVSGVVSLAQEEVVAEMRAPHLQLIEDLEKESAELVIRNGELETKLKNLSSSVRVLAERESVTKKELEELRQSYKESLVRLELLSGALDRDGTCLEQLEAAAKDHRVVESQKNEIAHALLNLSDAAEVLMEASGAESEIRLPVEEAIRSGEEALGLILRDDQFEEKSLAEAKVISVNKSYNLAVVDVGERQGLRVGTPVSIYRKDRTVGAALIIEVRDTFAGAILLESTDPNDQIIVGDSMRIDPEGV